MLTPADAAARVPVRLPDGRTARLISVPGPTNHRRVGGKARVILPSGAYLSVPVGELVALPADGVVVR